MSKETADYGTKETQHFDLFDPKVQAALAEDLREAYMSSDRNSEHQQYLGTVRSNLQRIGRSLTYRKKMKQLMHEHQTV